MHWFDGHWNADVALVDSNETIDTFTLHHLADKLNPAIETAQMHASLKAWQMGYRSCRHDVDVRGFEVCYLIRDFWEAELDDQTNYYSATWTGW
ncbi:hypothetical protein DNHGIG_23900 [Collibacillus ludicampi]|uniref:Uncharacterized protein n=1 Tax=Collibacillus ludicampi TaxID=2771369 RepID=A0AAV4LGG7_9BACL|nr:hypothetical protein [Collibacillus ludicampi]GIM46841.1 hypothetical protein DNHGIG_23900 [Collibacillus ludicampi]